MIWLTRFCCALVLFLAQATLPVGAAPAPAEVSALSQAMSDMRAGRWDDAATAAQPGGTIVSDIILWHRLRAGRGSFDQALDFLDRNADWPGLPYLIQRSEKTLPTSGRAEDVITFFGDAAPRTSGGTLALVTAYRGADLDGDAAAQAALAWLKLPLNERVENTLLRYYADVLEPLDEARLDLMLWDGEDASADRATDRLSDPALTALATARQALRANQSGIDAAIAAVPDSLVDDPGLARERFEWRMRNGRQSDAVTLLLEHSLSADALGQADRWASRRRTIARDLMRSGDHETAYAVASSHRLRSGSDFADLEWLSGYLSLRFLDQPERALAHFRRFRGSVVTPISLGRAGYWLGRAHDALGHEAEADKAFEFGARFQTSFYGLLAAEELGLSLDPALTGEQSYPAVTASQFQSSHVFQAGLLLQAAGERDLAERFLVHLSETLSAPEIGTLGDVALSLDEPHIAVMLAKQAARLGWTLPRPYYPVVDLGLTDSPVPLDLALSIARRESEFDPNVASGVGARGLMQLMPGTARDMSRLLGVSYSAERLFTDPVYNASLGTAYLKGLIDRFGDNIILVSAGYNAGPARPDRWMRDRGDPRSDGVDAIDWIEHIPFRETRNYVMRVAESLPVYRARITKEVGPITLRAELSAR